MTRSNGRFRERRCMLVQRATSRRADCEPAARVLGSNFFFHGGNAIFTRHAESNGLATSSQLRSSPLAAADSACEPVPRAPAKRRAADAAKETGQARRQKRAWQSRHG